MPPLRSSLAFLLATLVVIAPSRGSAQAAAPATAPSRADLVRMVDSMALAMVRNGPVASLSVGVVRGRDTLVMKAYGYADLENEVRATPGHVYRIGSITKQFTAAAIMRLAEQGKLSLDDDFTKHVAFPTQGRKVTIRQLLNHTSGIRSYTGSPAWGPTRRLDLSPDSIVALVVADTFDFAPGANWSYNNTGYVLLGMVIERVSGKSYDEYLRDEFFSPLGLSQTYYCHIKPVIPRRAQGYAVEEGRLVNAEYLSMTHPHAAGALCSTTADLVKWADALAHGRVVSAASFAAMTTPDSLPGGRAMPMGYGFGIAAGSVAPGHRVISHGGGINGFISDLAYYPDDSLIVVVLANTVPARPQELRRSIERRMLGLPAAAAASATAPVNLDTAQRARYVGEYRIELPQARTLDLRVWEEGGRLVSQATGQGILPLVAIGEHLFAVEADRGIQLQFKVEGARATELTLLQGGGQFRAPRIP